jgi:hypothetical protein
MKRERPKLAYFSRAVQISRGIQCSLAFFFAFHSSAYEIVTILAKDAPFATSMLFAGLNLCVPPNETLVLSVQKILAASVLIIIIIHV